MENSQSVKMLKIRTASPYGVIISSGAVEYLPFAIGVAKKAVIVSDETVFSIYGKKIKELLKSVGVETYSFIMPVGEKSKTKYVLDKLIILMTELNLDKSDCMIALGGGVVSDVTGLAAALFKRGIDYVNVPTSLVGMASACIGGKTGVEFLGKKDLIGLINHPKIVLCDTEFLKTLPEYNFNEGLSEIIKIAVACDKKFLVKLESQDMSIEDMIYSTLKIKEKLIKKDPFAKGVQNALAFGEVFKTAAENLVGATVAQGKSLAFGMVSAAFLAENLGLGRGVKDRIKALLNKFGLMYDMGVNNVIVYDKLFGDGRDEKEKITVVLPVRAGKCTVKTFSVGNIKEELYGR